MTKHINILTDIDPFLKIENLYDDIEYFRNRVDLLTWVSGEMQHHHFSMEENNGKRYEMYSLFMAIIKNDVDRAVDLVNANRKERFTS